MTTNGDREVYLAFLRKTEERKEPSWLRRERRWPYPWEFAALVIGAALLCAAIAFGVWDSITEPTWAQKVFVECRAQGKVPHVERAVDGKVLAVRCDVR